MALICPKCGAQNADNAYFCTACNAHIRSAFGSVPPTYSTFSASLTSERPKSIFRSPVAVAQGKVQEVSVAPASPIDPGPVSFDPPPQEPDNLQLLDQLEIVSDGKLMPPHLEQQRQVQVVPPPSTISPPPPAKQGGGFLPSDKTTTLPPPNKGLYQEVSLQDMFPALKSMGSKLTTSATATQSAGNTSGLREKAVLPAEAKGWSWAGFVPGGAFGFVVGIPWLGFLGLLGMLSGRFGLVYLWPLYILVVGMKGRELAWRGRCFESVSQYKEMTAAWDKTGLALIVVDIVIYGMVISIARAINP